jgi:hypothetical protein
MKKDIEYNPKLKIGDIVYTISDFDNEIKKLEIQGIIYEKYKNIFGEVQKNYFYRTNSIVEGLEELREDKLGKEFFIKEEDAKKMLEKLIERKKKEKGKKLKENYERIKKEYEEFFKNQKEAK